MKILVDGLTTEQAQKNFQLLTLVSEIKTPSFVRIINYSNDKAIGELAHYTINMGISYENAKEKDTEFLKDPENIKSIKFGLFQQFAETARQEMLDANQLKTIDSQVRSEAQIDAYMTIANNIRIHKETGRVLIYGLVVAKDVVKEGVYRPVNSRPLTIAKNMIRKELKATKFRQFALDKIVTVKAKGTEITIELALDEKID